MLVSVLSEPLPALAGTLNFMSNSARIDFIIVMFKQHRFHSRKRPGIYSECGQLSGTWHMISGNNTCHSKTMIFIPIYGQAIKGFNCASFKKMCQAAILDSSIQLRVLYWLCVFSNIEKKPYMLLMFLAWSIQGWLPYWPSEQNHFQSLLTNWSGTWQVYN